MKKNVLQNLVCTFFLEETTSSGIKPGRSSDESMLIKRKRIEAVSPSDRRVRERNENFTSSKNLTHSEPSKRPKTGIFFQRDSATVNIKKNFSIFKPHFPYLGTTNSLYCPRL